VGEADETSPERASRACIDELRSVIPSVGETSSLAPVIAYEPAWAIGRSDPAPPEHTRAVARELKEWLRQQNATRESRLIYGGSASLGLLSALSGVVDGLFLGRFAHDPEILVGVLDEAVDLVVRQ
jgi:triosephosphate isomerase